MKIYIATATVGLLAVAAFILGVWTEDTRWMDTGGILALPFAVGTLASLAYAVADQ